MLQEQVMIVGHSAGAHLAMMGVVGVTMKRLIHSPHSLILDELHSPWVPRPSIPPEMQLRFEDRYFDGSSEDSQTSTGAPGPCVVPGTGRIAVIQSFNSMVDTLDNGNNDNDGKSSDNSESFYMVEKNGQNSNKLEESVEATKTDDVEKTDTEKEVAADDSEAAEQESKDDENRSDDNDKDEEPSELIIEDEDELTDFQRDVKNIINSVKCVIGNFMLSLHGFTLLIIFLKSIDYAE